ncbi:YihY/virulence factor BrkB family protein [Novosphingobium soli]|uniref:YihY/virulence factor BrkB family protein n=1 Tax=Novosphingobium soli TaxID=574956 RepID=A0ABV6D0U4_9SPHN
MGSDGPPASAVPPAAAEPGGAPRHELLRSKITRDIRERAGPGTRVFRVVMRVLAGTWDDGFIHAGNLAYMTLLALFPFFIALSAIFAALGEQDQMGASIDAVLRALPPRVAEVLSPVAHDVAAARHGWLLWVGGLFGLWTAGSLVETIRDILHRAYGVTKRSRFWRSRLLSSALIFGSVLLLLISLSSQVLISAMESIVAVLFPGLDALSEQITISGAVSAGALFGSMYALFYLLTPSAYQKRGFPKWPGAALVTGWWLVVAYGLPKVLQTFFMYDLTYGSLAGVMIALFFFWLVGLGMVVGAELNAALAQAPEGQDPSGSPATVPGPNDKDVTGRNE